MLHPNALMSQVYKSILMLEAWATTGGKYHTFQEFHPNAGSFPCEKSVLVYHSELHWLKRVETYSGAILAH